ncbi:hypothetical protein M9Y10_033007 [Tritrichomonas musculus]|uniref:Uncharacterized protein n=1 Tax=Tritrichomonas musculus TaxID=1915356 RepID=A0ABR2GYG3_9EUKA
MEDDHLQLELIHKEAIDGNIDNVLNSLPGIIEQLNNSNLYNTAVNFLLQISSVCLKKNKVQEASNIANIALNIYLDQHLDEVLNSLIKFALDYPIDNQSISMINFFTKLIYLQGDKSIDLRKKLITFAESNLKYKPEFIQKMYLVLYKEFFQANATDQIIISYENNSILKDSIPMCFSRFLWSISANFSNRNTENNNDNNNENQKHLLFDSFQHSINAIFLRAVLIVSLQSENRELASLASRTLYESISLTKPNDIEPSILNHPFYHFGNLLTKLMMKHATVKSNLFKSIIDAFEKILFQDSEIVILLSLISQRYFNVNNERNL